MSRVPDACTLPVADQPTRLSEFDDLLRLSMRPPERPDRRLLRLFLPDDVDLRQQISDLVVRESACCSFFTFDLDSVDNATRLDIHVPPGQVVVLDAFQQREVELHDRARA